MKKKLLSVMLAVTLSVSCMTPLMALAKEGAQTETTEEENTNISEDAEEQISMGDISSIKQNGITYQYQQTTSSYFVTDLDEDVIVADILSEINGIPVTGIKIYGTNDICKMINIPDSVNYIYNAESLSYYFPTVEMINVAEENSSFSSQQGMLFNKEKTKLIQVPGQTKIATLNIPDTVKEISDRACFGLQNTKKITIPASVTYLEGDESDYTDGRFFAQCPNLKEIYVDEKNPVYTSVNGILYNKAKTTLLTCPGGITGKFIIPDGVQKLGQGAFLGCKNLTSVEMPAGISRISYYAFAYCPNLAEIIIPEGVTFMDDNAFDGDRALKRIILPKSLQGIGFDSFAGCDLLEKITFLNKDCVIIDRDDSIPKNTILCGEKSSTAQTYAEKYNRKFEEYTCPHNNIATNIKQKAAIGKDGCIEQKCLSCNSILEISTISAIKTASLSKTSYTYNGKNRKPSVTVRDTKGNTLRKGTDYTISYPKNCKKVGQYTVTIKFKGNYTGSTKKTYYINPKGTSLSEVKAKSKSFTAKWKKQTTQTRGYRLQYATDKKFKKNVKNVIIKKNKTTSQTVKKLKAKKKYYVRIRTYQTIKVNGKEKKLYSDWSKTKNVTVKK